MASTVLSFCTRCQILHFFGPSNDWYHCMQLVAWKKVEDSCQFLPPIQPDDCGKCYLMILFNISLCCPMGVVLVTWDAQCWPCCFQNDIFIIFSHFPPASYWFKSQITLSRDALGINLDKNKFCNPLAFMGWALRPCKVKSYKGLQGIHHMP